MTHTLIKILKPYSHKTEDYGLVFENQENHKHAGIAIKDIKSWIWGGSDNAEIKFIDSNAQENVILLNQSRVDLNVLKAEGMYLRHRTQTMKALREGLVIAELFTQNNLFGV